jgi:hypothetical protein
MTVVPADIAKVSPFVVSSGNSGDFTKPQFDKFFAIAKQLIDAQDPGVASETYDYMHSLMICHYYVVFNNKLEFKSESSGGGDYIYQKQAGVSTFSIAYDKLLQQWEKILGKANIQGSEDAGRIDAYMGDVSLDKVSTSLWNEDHAEV